MATEKVYTRQDMRRQIEIERHRDDPADAYMEAEKLADMLEQVLDAEEHVQKLTTPPINPAPRTRHG